MSRDAKIQPAWSGKMVYALLLGVVLALAMLAIAMLVVRQPAFAATTATSEESAKSVRECLIIGDDSVWAGQNLYVKGESAPHDLLAAGQTLSVRNSVVPGSLRMAGQDVLVADTEVGHGVSLAGQDVVIAGGSAQGVSLAGQNVTFSGEAAALYIVGETVYLDGTVHGNAVVQAKSLVLGENANIEGTLDATLADDPSVAVGSHVGELAVTISESDVASSVAAAGVLGGMSLGLSLLNIGGFILVAVLCEWLARKHTKGAAAMIKERTGSHVGTGIVAAIVAPFVIILLCCLVVTLPLAGALALALVAITLVGGGFLAAAVGKLAFPKMGRYQSSILMAAILGACSVIGILDGLITVAGFMFLLGYILQRLYLGLQDKPGSQPDDGRSSDAFGSFDSPDSTAGKDLSVGPDYDAPAASAGFRQAAHGSSDQAQVNPVL